MKNQLMTRAEEILEEVHAKPEHAQADYPGNHWDYQVILDCINTALKESI